MGIIYLNDLRFCLKKCSSNHFADDTCLIHASKRIKTLGTDLNTDLKATSEWLKANRLSLNVKKSKLIIFHSKLKKVDFTSFSLKFEGIKLCQNMSNTWGVTLMKIYHGVLIAMN